MKRIPELDGLRAIAILAVMEWHLTRWIGAGFLGVDIFFVLSGFLITSLLLAEEKGTGRISLGGFYLRRARRILPALFAMVGFMALYPEWAARQAVWAALTFTGNFPDVDMSLIGNVWSLAVEEHFYLVWPLAFVLSARARTASLVGAVLVAIALRTYANAVDNDWLAYFFTFSRADELAIGCLCAIHVEKFRAPPWASIACIVAMLLFIAFGSLPFARGFGFTAFALCVAVAIVAIVSGDHPALGQLLRSNALQYIGTRSYGLYLWHFPIFTGFAVEGAYPMWIKMCLRVAMTFAVAELSYRTVEAWFRAPRKVSAGELAVAR